MDSQQQRERFEKSPIVQMLLKNGKNEEVEKLWIQEIWEKEMKK